MTMSKKNRIKAVEDARLASMAEDALLAIMADESLADSLPKRIVNKINKWYMSRGN